MFVYQFKVKLNLLLGGFWTNPLNFFLGYITVWDQT